MRRILTDERGFLMIAMMGLMLVVSIAISAALLAPGNDVRLVGNDLNQKQAYDAAQAGINNYVFHLNADANYWTYCAPRVNPAARNQNGSVANWQFVPGSTVERYADELIPATGQSSCSLADPVTSMIESSPPAAGTFRIRSTGFAGKAQQSIVATFRRKSFVDYVYYTKFETLDPSAYASASDRSTAATTCNRAARNNRPIGSGGSPCSQISFVSSDTVNGPLHTEDRLVVCGTPTFGRSASDAIEVVDPVGWTASCNGSSPHFTGTEVASASGIDPPPDNSQLANLALPAYRYSGQTHITLNPDATMTVTTGGASPRTVPYPSNGVVYVSSTAVCPGYTPFGVTYGAGNTTATVNGQPVPAGCGILTVNGTYNQPLTLGSDNDVVIDGNLTSSNSAVLGLIADNFVRVFHPCANGTNGAGTLSSPTINAAMLAVRHSFIVDNYDCGSSPGTLNVTGAIAQIYRGPVGTFNSNGVSTGYAKNYNYDNHLHAQEPPHFLDPVQAAWHIDRESQCARGTTICS